MILKIACILLFSLVLSVPAQGVKLVHADKNIGRYEHGQQFRILEGKVMFLQDSTEIHCNLAEYTEISELISLSGDVVLIDGQSKIWADRVKYWPEDKIAECYDQVRMRSENDSLAADFFRYSFRTEDAEAAGKVFILDKPGQVEITGNKSKYINTSQFSVVSGQACLKHFKEDSSDTLIITADILTHTESDKAFATARGQVRIEQGSLEATSDSAVYFIKEEIAELIGQPAAKFDNSKMSGEKILVFMDSSAIHKIDIREKARATTLADSLRQNYNLLTGRRIIMHIKNKKPELLRSLNNATSIYYLLDEETSQAQGDNYATADSIRVYFTGGELDSIAIRGGAQGIYYPDSYKGKRIYNE